MDELIKMFATEMADRIYNEIINNLTEKFKVDDINSIISNRPADDDDHDYIALADLDVDKQQDIMNKFNRITTVAASDHTYERAAERGISADVLKRLEYCTTRNIIGLQNNGRLRVGIRDGREVVICIICIEKTVATIVTCWRSQLVDLERYEVDDMCEF